MKQPNKNKSEKRICNRCKKQANVVIILSDTSCVDLCFDCYKMIVKFIEEKDKLYTKSEVDEMITEAENKMCLDCSYINHFKKLETENKQLKARQNEDIRLQNMLNKRIIELEAKLKEQAKEIFDDIWRKYIENADLGGDCLSFSEDVFIPCKKKWVGRK